MTRRYELHYTGHFFKQHLYLDKVFIHRPAIAWNVFPKKDSDNLVIIVPYKYTGEASVFIVNITPDLETIHHGQCFPFYIYTDNDKLINITDYSLHEYQNHYNNAKITKKDIFLLRVRTIYTTQDTKRSLQTLFQKNCREFQWLPTLKNSQKWAKNWQNCT